MSHSEAVTKALVDALEVCAGMEPEPPEWIELRLGLIGPAASIMVRRRFSTANRREITAYVLGLFGGDDPRLHPKCRMAETLIHSELGELGLVRDLPPATELFNAMFAILADLGAAQRL